MWKVRESVLGCRGLGFRKKRLLGDLYYGGFDYG